MSAGSWQKHSAGNLKQTHIHNSAPLAKSDDV